METEAAKIRKELLEDAKDALIILEPIMGEEECQFVRETMEALVEEVKKGGK